MYKTKKGSVILEAAIMMPIFIIAVLTLVYMMKIILIQEIVFHNLVNEARKTGLEAYYEELIFKTAGARSDWNNAVPIDSLSLEYRLRKKLNLDSTDELREVNVDHKRYWTSTFDIDDLIRIDLNYSVYPALPFGFKDSFLIEQRVLFRGWTGTLQQIDKLTFSELEREEKSKPIYIFPKAGEKYHGKTCIYIENNPTEEFLSKIIRNSYTPCSICDAEAKPNGTLVYCYKKTGKAYHLSTCPIVERYTINMEEQAARDQGYLPCSICGGK